MVFKEKSLLIGKINLKLIVPKTSSAHYKCEEEEVKITQHDTML